MLSFNQIALLIFALAVAHTLLASQIHAYARRLSRTYKESFFVEILSFLGEVEVIFGIWLIPLLICMTFYFSWDTTIEYLEKASMAEPIFVVVIMSMASTKPVISFAEQGLHLFARMGGQTVKAWWATILTLGPLLGSFITEPAAMTLCAVLLGKYFYRLKPKRSFAYATLGLLFTNVSVGGVLTSFAAPPVLMISHKWSWDSLYMLTHFGYKAILGILIANVTYFLIYREEFKKLERDNLLKETVKEKKIPFWITFTHLCFLIWVVLNAEHPIIFGGAFLFFIGFMQATKHFQSPLELKGPILVGFFLAALVLHTGLQGWWIQPLLSKASYELLMVLSIALTAFNDNAAITLLASQVPNFSELMKYAVVAGAVSGGGLTVIANAPNPAGQALLYRYFPDGISSLSLFLAALFPTIVMALIFYFLRL